MRVTYMTITNLSAPVPRLYAIGGFNGITRMNNGERYNIDTNQWQNIAEMYSPRSNFGIEVSNAG